MAMGMLVNGQWVDDFKEHDEHGRFDRPPTRFRNKITADGSSPFPAEAGRYHLYVSLGCPWAHRAAMFWNLKGLEGVIGLSIVDPAGPSGWIFSAAYPDHLYGASELSEIYLKAAPDYTGRVTVPVLWDCEKSTIVNNESREIIRMFDYEFNAFARCPERDFCPPDLKECVEQTLDAIYMPINNGVYRCGFAQSQAAYDEAVTELFAALDHWEDVLAGQRYLCGDRITEADWCLFSTFFRFDLAYYGLFKCNLRRLVDYPNLWAYFRDLYHYSDVRDVCSVEHVKLIYYKGIGELNPSGIVPKGPLLDYDKPHGRERLNAK